MRKIGTLVSVMTAMLLTSVAFAQEDMPPMAPEGGADQPDVVGRVGAGYFTTTAPVGVRYWFGEGRGIDAGLGLSISKPSVPDGAPDPDTQTAIGFEFGYLHTLSQSQNLNIFFRPGLGILHTDTGASDFGVNINGSLCGEMYLAGLGLPHVSLTAGMGLGVQINTPEGQTTAFGFSLFHTGASIVTASPLVGVHMYF